MDRPGLIRLHFVRDEITACVRLPRDVGGSELQRALGRLGYEKVRQRGDGNGRGRKPLDSSGNTSQSAHANQYADFAPSGSGFPPGAPATNSDRNHAR